MENPASPAAFLQALLDAEGLSLAQQKEETDT
jgi:hypothetical protein